MSHNYERDWRGRSYRRGGSLVRDIRAGADLRAAEPDPPLRCAACGLSPCVDEDMAPRCVDVRLARGDRYCGLCLEWAEACHCGQRARLAPADPRVRARLAAVLAHRCPACSSTNIEEQTIGPVRGTDGKLVGRATCVCGWTGSQSDLRRNAPGPR